MKRLERLVRNFRNAIDTAGEEDRFINYPPFNKFTEGCCEHTSDLLCQYLLENGIKTYLVRGERKATLKECHVWLELVDEIVIDITEDQFINKLVKADEADIVRIGREGKVQKNFFVKRVKLDQTNFTNPEQFSGFGGQPNAYQKRLIEVNEIIREYL